MNTIPKFKSFITTVGLAMAPEDLFQKRAEWIASLSEDEILELLVWVENSDDDELLKSLSKPYQLSVLQEAIIIAASVGKRLNSEQVRERFEALFHNKRLKELVIEGIDIYGNKKSLPFLASIISSESDEQILMSIASALNSIGGEEALKLLVGIKNKIKFSKEFHRSLLEEIIEEVKNDSSEKIN